MAFPGGPAAPAMTPNGQIASVQPAQTDASSGGGYAARPPAAPTGAYSFSVALRNDPFLKTYLGGYGTGTAANALGRDTSRDQLLAQYGRVPSAAQLGFNPGAEAYGLANAATQGGVSTTARLAQAYRTTNAGDAAAAASRGLGHSGLVGQYTQENLRNYGIQQADALNSLLGQLGGVQKDYLAGQATQQQGLAQAYQDAYTRALAGIKAGVVR